MDNSEYIIEFKSKTEKLIEKIENVSDLKLKNTEDIIKNQNKIIKFKKKKFFKKKFFKKKVKEFLFLEKRQIHIETF